MRNCKWLKTLWMVKRPGNRTTFTQHIVHAQILQFVFVKESSQVSQIQPWQVSKTQSSPLAVGAGVISSNIRLCSYTPSTRLPFQERVGDLGKCWWQLHPQQSWCTVFILLLPWLGLLGFLCFLSLSHSEQWHKPGLYHAASMLPCVCMPVKRSKNEFVHIF